VELPESTGYLMSGSNSLFDSQTPIADQIASNPVGTSMLWGIDPNTLQPYQQAAPAQTVNAKNLLGMPMANVAMGFGDSPGTMAGVGAKTADLAALRAAQKMASRGVDSDAIWKNTGWGQGADGQWRFEIPDNNARIGGKDFTPGDQLTLGHVMDHPDLFAAYPDLANMPVHGMPKDLVNQGYRGAYDPTAGAMWVTGGRSPSETLSTVLHENQHAVQTREGFQNGGNLNESTLKAVDNLPVYRDQVAGMDRQMQAAGLDHNLIKQALAMGDGAAQEAMQQLSRLGPDFATTYRENLSRLGTAQQAAEFYRTGYSNMAGEVEARNTQSRQSLTAAQRRQMPPDWTQDVPTEQQVVIQGTDGGTYRVTPVSRIP
jgi:hypothetical protein